MRLALAMCLVVLAGPALACRKMSEADCRAWEARDAAAFNRDYSEFLADNRARESDRLLRDLTEEVRRLREQQEQRCLTGRCR